MTFGAYPTPYWDMSPVQREAFAHTRYFEVPTLEERNMEQRWHDASDTISYLPEEQPGILAARSLATVINMCRASLDDLQNEAAAQLARELTEEALPYVENTVLALVFPDAPEEPVDTELSDKDFLKQLASDPNYVE